VNPTYISILFSDDVGNILIVIGLCWMTLGVIIMRNMVSFEI
jgi:tight adherence protein B